MIKFFREGWESVPTWLKAFSIALAVVVGIAGGTRSARLADAAKPCADHVLQSWGHSKCIHADHRLEVVEGVAVCRCEASP